MVKRLILKNKSDSKTNLYLTETTLTMKKKSHICVNFSFLNNRFLLFWLFLLPFTLQAQLFIANDSILHIKSGTTIVSKHLDKTIYDSVKIYVNEETILSNFDDLHNAEIVIVSNSINTPKKVKEKKQISKPKETLLSEEIKINTSPINFDDFEFDDSHKEEINLYSLYTLEGISFNNFNVKALITTSVNIKTHFDFEEKHEENFQYKNNLNQYDCLKSYRIRPPPTKVFLT